MSSNTKSGAKVTAIGCFMVLALLLSNICLGCYSTEYVFNFLCGHHPAIWICVLIGMFLGEFAVPGMIIAYALQFFGVAHPLFR